MEKIFITFEHLSMDLQLAAENKKAYNVLNIFTYIAVPGSILGMFLLAKENFIGLLFMLASTICLLVEVFGRRIVDGRSAKIVTESILQGELCVSVETLDHVERKVIEEPYDSRVRMWERKRKPSRRSTFYCFASGKQWTPPDLEADYAWAEYAFIRAGGLANISKSGDEFYYIFLKNKPEIAYIYPCKYFALDKRVQKKANM